MRANTRKSLIMDGMDFKHKLSGIGLIGFMRHMGIEWDRNDSEK